MKVLVVGSGGREHALVWKLAQSPSVTAILCAPGNPGTAQHAENLELIADDVPGIVQAAVERGVGLVVVGPEVPLVKGLGDALRERGIPVFGPSKEGAELEGSKAWSKALMQHNGIPTAGFRVLTSERAAREYLDGAVVWPLVIKASGLAGGKGVFIVKDREEAQDAIQKLMGSRSFGKSGETVVIEDYLVGYEVSIHAFTDGATLASLPSAQDHKRVFDGGEGPNTGGMGAVSPAPRVVARDLLRIERDILAPTLHALRREERPYRGAIFAGLMMTRTGPRVLEYNARCGDPETQVMLPRLRGDLCKLLLATAEGRLHEIQESELDVDPRTAVTVVLTSAGYPGFFTTGVPIHGVDAASALPDVLVFHAGTALREGQLVTAGGRVLAVTALGDDVDQARAKAYAAVQKIHFEGMHYRKDIGAVGVR